MRAAALLLGVQRLLLGARLLAEAQHAAKPADSPCVTWLPLNCMSDPYNDVDKYIPAIISSWEWHSSGACGSPGFGGSCTPCSGQPHDFQCGWIFPCYSSAAGVFGHKDVAPASGAPCMAHVPGSPGNVSSQTCGMYAPGKGPHWQGFGWQVTQKGSHPSRALGQLISVVTNGTTFVLARSPAATPFRNCGPGSVGWVELAPDGTLGCMEAAANCVPWEQCNGYEVAYCKVCQPCPAIYNASFSPGPGCPNCTKPDKPPPPPPPPPPTPKPGGQPCIRFGNTIANAGVVDATITQDSTTYTWKGYRFSKFSDWVTIFHGGVKW